MRGALARALHLRCQTDHSFKTHPVSTPHESFCHAFRGGPRLFLNQDTINAATATNAEAAVESNSSGVLVPVTSYLVGRKTFPPSGYGPVNQRSTQGS